MKLTARNLKEKSIINTKVGKHNFYRLILNEPPGKVLDIVRKGRFYYKYVGLYDLGNTPLTLMNDLELIRSAKIENIIF